MKAFTDDFKLDDGWHESLEGWRLFTGTPWLQDNALGLGGGINQVVALVSEALDSKEHMAHCTFQITADSDTPTVGLMVRAEFQVGVSPRVLHRCYLVTISGSGVLRLYSILTSDPTPSPLATAECSLSNDEAHELVIKVRDVSPHEDNLSQAGAELLIFLDDKVNPVLHTVDRRTMRPEGLYTGFDISDTTGGDSVSIGEFYSYVLRSSVVRNPFPIPVLRTFGDLKYEMAYRLDRNGNSQFPGEVRGAMLNDAMNEIYAKEGYWHWAERVLYFYTTKGVRTYELPAWVAIPGGMTDRTNARVQEKGTWKEMRRLDPGDNVGQSSPYRYNQVGWGDFGGPVIAIEPIPGGVYTIEMPYYAKPVPMVEDTDIPMIPPEFTEVLIYGGLKRAAQVSDAKTLYTISAAEHEVMYRTMRRANNREADRIVTLRTQTQVRRQARGMRIRPYGAF